MIWSDGKILPDDGLSIPVTDRTFEHGLGLFETFRTYNGRPTLLEQHKARMIRSAGDLQLPIEPASLPDEAAVRVLLDAEGDRMIRITATGGTSTNPSVVWMRSGPLPEPPSEKGASLLLEAWNIAPTEPLAGHKTLNYWSRRAAFDDAKRRGFDESLSLSSQLYFGERYHEGSRTNLFVVGKIGSFSADRPMLTTAATNGLIVPGIIRQLILEIAGGLPIDVNEAVPGIPLLMIRQAAEIFLTNSVRGIVPVGRIVLDRNQREYLFEAPGPVTRQFQEILATRLWPEPS
jgi:branched-subunit amino acid aminotransferase/4-amino-4-deoxychorismate lyase